MEEDINDIIQRIQSEALGGKIKVLYVAPERMALSGFENFLKNLKNL